MTKRLWEIDFLRGLAIVLMILFHLMVDLRDFYGYLFDYAHGWLYYAGKLSAGLFLLLAGLSTRFSRRPLRHGLQILGWGMVVTLVTYLYNPAVYVRFGILHLIGSGLMLSYGTRGFDQGRRIILALGLLAGGRMAAEAATTRVWLVPLGIVPAGFASLDYYPLLPWAGVILLGAWAGEYLYPAPRSLLKHEPGPNPLTYMGRHSLSIYLLHQPLLLVLLWLIHGGR